LYRYFLQGAEVEAFAVEPSPNDTVLSATHLPVHLTGAPISGILTVLPFFYLT